MNELTYRERLHLSCEQYADEPIEKVAFAFAKWSAEAKRDKLEAVRANSA